MTEQKHSKFSDKATQETVNKVNETLANLSGGSLKVAELFRDRKDGQSYIEKPPAMSIEDVVLQGTRIIQANAQMVDFTRQFKARPDDGAVAFAQVISQTYGFGAVGKPIPATMFTPEQLPEYKTVVVGPRESDGTTPTVEVPWGLMEFAPLQAQFVLQHAIHHEYGHCFEVVVSAPKKMQGAINGLFMLVEEYLKRNSIYRNKALHGVGKASRSDGIVSPEFVNVYNSDRSKIVYTEHVSRDLLYSVFGVIEHTDALRSAGKDVGKKVLLWGPNGSGKTEAATAAMQIALENGWTAIRARYDEDIAKVIAFAEQVGTPCVVVVEDCEKLMVPAQADHQEMDKMLDLFDGAGAKGREVMLVMTSNHVQELTKSMTRPGRINRLINIANLDREAFERLFKILVNEDRLDNIDYDALFDAFPECAPVWIVEAINRAEESVIIRTGKPGEKFVTDDFLFEAAGLAEHLDVHRAATDKPAKETLGEALSEIVGDKVEEILSDYRVDFHDMGNIVERVND